MKELDIKKRMIASSLMNFWKAGNQKIFCISIIRSVAEIYKDVIELKEMEGLVV